MKSSLFLINFFAALVSYAQTHTVINTNDSGPGSLRQTIINASAGDTIRFSQSLLANGSDTVSLFFPISIYENITIKGLYNATDTLYISGSDSTQLFYIGLSATAVETVRLDSLVLINGKSSTEGGCIYVSEADSLIVTNSIIRNNRTVGGVNGGGLIAYNSTVRMDNCRVESNQTGSTGGYGGGLRFKYSDVIVENSVFVNNRCAYAGGGISSVECGYVRVINSEFYFNQTDSNPAVYGGGAVYTNTSDNTFIYRSTFYGNLSGEGGALYLIDNMTDTIRECVFIENTTDFNGGAIFAGTFSFAGKSSLSCTGSLFSGNSSVHRGGAMFIDGVNYSISGVNYSVNIETSTFTQNESSQYGGGALWVESSIVDIRNSTFESNESPVGTPIISSGINNQSEITVANSIVLSGLSNPNFGGAGSELSGGHNIFSDSSSFALTSDQTNIDSTILALEPLADYGGFTHTMIPSLTSVALNAGDSTDFSDAQNGPIFGRRDIGAAERPVISSDTLLACSPVNWWGNMYSTAGTYRDTVFNANSIDSVSVLVLHRQDTSLINDSGVLIALENDSNTTYQWVDCDNGFAPVAGATDSAFMPTVNGTYAVILTNGTCSDTSACILYDEVSIEEAARSRNWVTFYPNPTSGEIQYKFEGTVPASLEVLDLGGRQIFSRQLSHNHYLTLPGIPAGTYFLRWTGEDGTVQVDRVVVR